MTDSQDIARLGIYLTNSLLSAGASLRAHKKMLGRMQESSYEKLLTTHTNRVHDYTRMLATFNRLVTTQDLRAENKHYQDTISEMETRICDLVEEGEDLKRQLTELMKRPPTSSAPRKPEPMHNVRLSNPQT